jgi:hypothetical protein
MVVIVYLILKFSSGLKDLKSEDKRLETISATVVPAHQKHANIQKVSEIV